MESSHNSEHNSEHNSSAASNSHSRSSLSSSAKNVRFDQVEIREYHRTVGDNPSVSVGPPVGIDWNYYEAVKSSLEEYESFRGPRREQLELILTRNERDHLLVEWGVPTHRIAAGTRSALKAKNQRKQTIVNAGKMARLEEAIEAASKRFKGAFSSKGVKTIETIPENEEVDQADSVETANVTDISEKQEQEGNSVYSSNNTPASRVVSVEPETDINFDKLGMNVTVSRVVSDAPEGALMASCSSLQFDHEGEDCKSMDDGYTLGATTFGNKSATPSVVEMEKFYRELEMEMFGDDDDASLPCMVGETLEVSLDASVNSDRDDITIATAFRSMSSTKIEVLEPDSQAQEEDELDTSQYGGSPIVDQRCSYPVEFQHPKQEHFHHTNTDQAAAYAVSNAILYNYDQQQDQEFDNHFTSQRSRSRSGSFESMLDQKSVQHNERPQPHCNFMQPRYPVYSTPQSQMVSWNNPSPQQHWKNNAPYNPMPTTRHGVYRSNGRSYFDGPQITHSPIHGHLSPNQWMGECDGRGSRSYVNAAVTIVEDNFHGVSAS
ncbi:MAG: hypothetical protein SGILL_008326 [Bacillariaceae sp.]